MVKGHQQRPWLVVEDLYAQLVGRERQPGHRRVHPVIQQCLARFVPVQVHGLHVGVRVPVPQLAHGGVTMMPVVYPMAIRLGSAAARERVPRTHMVATIRTGGHGRYRMDYIINPAKRPAKALACDGSAAVLAAITLHNVHYRRRPPAGAHG